MPASHTWELLIDGQMLEGSKAEISKLAKAAKAANREYTIYENGEPVAKKTVKQGDTFKHTMFIELTKLGYRVSSLTREFDNGMTPLDLREEIGDILNKFEDMYKQVDTRINENTDNTVYGPQEPATV